MRVCTPSKGPLGRGTGEAELSPGVAVRMYSTVYFMYPWFRPRWCRYPHLSSVRAAMASHGPFQAMDGRARGTWKTGLVPGHPPWSQKRQTACSPRRHRYDRFLRCDSNHAMHCCRTDSEISGSGREETLIVPYGSAAAQAELQSSQKKTACRASSGKLPPIFIISHRKNRASTIEFSQSLVFQLLTIRSFL